MLAAKESPGAENAGAVTSSDSYIAPLPKITPDNPLFQEFARQADAAHQPRARAWLTGKAGVPADMLYHNGGALVGCVRIGPGESLRPDRIGRYWPDATGRHAVVVPVTEINRPISVGDGTGLDPLDTIIDLVAFCPDNPDRLYLRTGDGAILNVEAVRDAYERNRALMVRRNVLAWLQGGGVGSVILDWHPPATILHNCRRITSDDQTTLAKLKLGLNNTGPDIRLSAVDDG